MDRRVIVGVGLLAAAVIAAGAWFLLPPGRSEPWREYVPPDEQTAPAEPAEPVLPSSQPSSQPSAPAPALARVRGRATSAPVTDAGSGDAAESEDDAPPDDDGATIRVSGVVMDDADRRVPGAQVYAWRMRRGRRTDVVSATSDATGRFVLPVVAKGARIAASAPEMLGVEERCGACDLELLLRAERRHVVAGRFVRADDPALPAVGVPIRSPRGLVARSDAEGRWSLDLFGPGVAECVVAPPDERGSERWATASLSIEASVSEVEVDVLLAGTLRGRVHDAEGHGVVANLEWSHSDDERDVGDKVVRSPGVGIVVRRPSRETMKATSDSSGEFELRGVRAGRGTLHVSASDSAAELLPTTFACTVWFGAEPEGTRDRRVLVTANRRVGHLASYTRGLGTERLDVQLAKSAAIAGRVVQMPPDILARWIVAVDETGLELADRVEIRADGSFDLRHLRAGEGVWLRVPHAGAQWLVETSRPVRAGDSDVEVRFVSAVTEIRGVLLDSSGVPASGRSIALYHLTPRGRRGDEYLAAAKTGDDGRFVITGIRGGPNDLSADGIRFATVTPGSDKRRDAVGDDGLAAVWLPPGEEATMRMPVLHRFVGRVRSAGSALPNGSVWIDVVGGDWVIHHPVMDGRFDIPAPAGTHRISLRVYDRPSVEIESANRDPERADDLTWWRAGELRSHDRLEITIPGEEFEFVIPAEKPR